MPLPGTDPPKGMANGEDSDEDGKVDAGIDDKDDSNDAEISNEDEKVDEGNGRAKDSGDDEIVDETVKDVAVSPDWTRLGVSV